MTATAADTCIHGDCTSGSCHPVAIVDDELFDAASTHKRQTWTEIIGAGDGFSAPITGPLRDRLMDAYRAATGAEHPGQLVWLRTADYQRATWQPNPDHVAWLARYEAASSDERQRMTADGAPPMGTWRDRTGDCLCFLTLAYTGELRFVGY